jgi:hypothetical protein
MFRRSSKCEAVNCVEVDTGCDNVQCVEVDTDRRGVAIRNSASPGGEFVAFTREEWAAFIAGVKLGEFDVEG